MLSVNIRMLCLLMCVLDYLVFQQDGTVNADFLRAASVLGDGSVLLVGYTWGDWNNLNAGQEDFAAVILDVDGVELWRWQVRRVYAYIYHFVLRTRMPSPSEAR